MFDAHFDDKPKDKQMKLMGKWSDFKITQTQVDFDETWNEGINDLKQNFTIEKLKIFVTNDYPLN